MHGTLAFLVVPLVTAEMEVINNTGNRLDGDGMPARGKPGQMGRLPRRPPLRGRVVGKHSEPLLPQRAGKCGPFYLDELDNVDKLVVLYVVGHFSFLDELDGLG